MDQYFYLEGTQQKGPFSIDDLPEVGLKRDTLVWKNGYSDWVQAATVPEFIDFFSLKVPPPPPAQRAKAEAQQREAERIREIQQRNLQKMRAIKDRERERFRALADRITVKGVQARYRLFKIFFWLNVSVVPLWLGGLLAVNQARQNYWMHDWIYPDEQVNGFTAFVMNNHIHPETIHAIAGILFGLFALMTLVSRLNFLHYAWSGIQIADKPSANPNQAVGFLLIPGYHFIWMFTAYKSLAEDLRHHILDMGYEHLELVRPGLAQGFCITRIGLCIPMINLFAIIPMFVFNILYHANIKKGLVYVLEQKRLQKVEYKEFEERPVKEAAFV